MNSKISVYARLRPHGLKDGMFLDDGIKINGSTISVDNLEKGRSNEYSLNGCFGPYSTQEDVFGCVQPLLVRVLAGYSATVFAYGVTGSGKTTTMQGTAQSPGVTLRAARALLDHVSSPANTRQAVISMSYLEILNDEIYDLLNDRTESGSMMAKLKICRDSDGNDVVLNLMEKEVNDYEEFRGFYNHASKLRRTAATKLNTDSSRSHAIVTLHHRAYDAAGGIISDGKIRLCDLAGSEDNKLTGNVGERLRESSSINKSLTVLGYVIEDITSNAPIIRYRDSKLTRVLKDALGGTSLGLMICCIAPGEKHVKNTNNSLSFATRAKKVVTGIASIPLESQDDRRYSAPAHALGLRRPVRHALTSRPISQNIRDPRLSLPVAKPARWNPSAVTRPGSTASAKGSNTAQNAIKPIVSGISEGRARELFDVWYEERKEAEQEEARKAIALTSATQMAVRDAADMTHRLRELPRQLSASEIEAMPVEERDRRGQILIQYGRKFEHSAEIARALECYTHASLYIPRKEKLITRITELQLYLDGERGSSSSAMHEGQQTLDSGIHNSGIKRSRGFKGDSLATLSGDLDVEMNETEGEKRSIRGRYEGPSGIREYVLADAQRVIRAPAFTARQ